MPDISILHTGNTAYNIKDAIARTRAANAETSAAAAQTAANGAVAAAGNALTTANTAQTRANAAYELAEQAASGASVVTSAAFFDVSASNGTLTVTTDSVPVLVLLNNTLYHIQGMTKSSNTFTIPVAPILAAANLASYNGTYRVYVAQGINGTTPQRGTDYWTTADKDEIKQYCLAQILEAEW